MKRRSWIKPHFGWFSSSPEEVAEIDRARYARRAAVEALERGRLQKQRPH
jgi:hypothetical protein